MRVALVNDTHYGFKKSSKLFRDYFELFYKNIFFPTLEKEGITTVVHMGDAFDSRKSIDLQSLEWTKRVVLEPLSKYQVHMIVGNHDIFFRNSNKINSPQLLLDNYKNIQTYSEPTEIQLDNLKVLLLPWINAENEELSMKMIQNTKAKIVMGHLELQGFKVNRQTTSDYGLVPIIFDRFTKVFSGHYHTRSHNGKIYYTGNPYEMFWSDVNDERGFTIFDTETLEHKFINNPYTMFHNIYYEDNDHQLLNATQYENKIVKVIVRKKSDPKKFEKFIDKLHASNVAELKIVENFSITESENFEAIENEDTFSILNRYIEESEIDLDKTVIQKMMQEIYQEACEMV